jgi:hypothetical protein
MSTGGGEKDGLRRLSDMFTTALEILTHRETHTHTLAHTRDLCVSIPSISFHLTCPPPPSPSPRPATKAQTISFCLFIYSLRFFDDQVECKHVRDPGEKCLFSPSKGPWDTRLMSSAEPGRGRCNRYS